MSDIKKTLENYPDISFVDNLTLEELQNQMIADFEEKYNEETGTEATLAAGDPNRIILYAASLQLYQAFMYLDNAGKQSLLKYSYGDFLENVGALKGIERNPSTPAKTTIRFTLSAAQPGAITIPIGTRCTAGNGIYFATTEASEIDAGDLTVDIPAECTTNGIIGNGYVAGQINAIVDTIAFVQSVSNITASEGGAEIESDNSLADRIFLSPSSYSTAGPDDAYVYWAKNYSSDITDVRITSPSDGVVDIRFILSGGEIPGAAMIEALEDYLQDEKIRPLTDNVTVQAPDTVSYNIAAEYWINESDKNQAEVIQANVTTAVTNYKNWQREVIGRDINPSKLISMMMAAGAKRVEVTYPVFTAIDSTDLAVNGTTTITYGGVEDD